MLSVEESIRGTDRRCN